MVSRHPTASRPTKAFQFRFPLWSTLIRNYFIWDLQLRGHWTRPHRFTRNGQPCPNPMYAIRRVGCCLAARSFSNCNSLRHDRWISYRNQTREENGRLRKAWPDIHWHACDKMLTTCTWPITTRLSKELLWYNEKMTHKCFCATCLFSGIN